MRKSIKALSIIALCIFIAIFLSACGSDGTGGRIGAGIGGGTPEGGLPDAVAGTLSGSVWHDLNQNGIIDPGEPGIPGIEVDLYEDTNENGEFDLGSDESITTTTTDSNGDYSFTVDSTGRYFISILHTQPAIFGLLLTTSNDAPEWEGLPWYRYTLIADITNLTVGIKNLNFGFFNPTKWGFDISPNGSPIDIISSPAIAPDGTIYIGSGNGALYAINPNGTLKWKYETGGAISGSPAIGTDGTVYIGSFDRQIYAINPVGTLKWVYPTKSNFTSSPAIGSNGTIYIAGTHQDRWVYLCPDDTTREETVAILYALTPNGVLLWDTVLSGYVHSSPAIATNGTIYIGSYGDNDDLSNDRLDRCDEGSIIPASDADPDRPVNGHLYAINSTNGAIIWDFKTLGDVLSSPAIGNNGVIYVGSDAYDFVYGEDTTEVIGFSPSTEGYLYAINPDGTLLWYFDAFGDVDCSPAIGTDGTVYFGSDKNDVFALNPDGTLLWVYPTRDDVKSSPAIAADGTIYIGSNDGSLYVLNPDGTLNTHYIKDAGFVNSSPSIGTDGTVYFATEGGYLFAIVRTSPLASTPWPKFRHDLPNTGRQ